MKKILISSLLLLSFYSNTLAQSAQYSCPNINRTLYFGTRGQDVRELQTFLFQYNNYPNSNATGYFGILTYRLTQTFQKQNNIYPSGIVGNLTRARIAALCQANPIPPNNPNPGYCTAIYKPVCGLLNNMPKTFSNECMLNNSGAQYLYEGECRVNDPGTAPNNCKIWYDGCNTCSRQYVGGPMMCTLMACFTQNTPYCREYFSSNPGGGTVCTADAKLCPNGTYVGRTGPNCQFVCPY